MPRVKSNPVRLRRKKQVMKAAKGYYGARSKLWGPAKESVERAWRYAYRDRKNKKREFRRLWVIRINAGAHLNGMNYSTFISGLMKAGIEIDRKILSDIAIQDPAAFSALADKARAALTAA
jgi:large subunit ribosomal protein L20